MAPRNIRERKGVDLRKFSETIDAIIPPMANAHAEAWSGKDLESALKYSRKIQRSARTLIKHTEKLIGAFLELNKPPKPRPPLNPGRQGQGKSKGSGSQQGTALDCCYRGKIKFGLAQKGRIVPTIQETMKDWDGYQKLGFFKVTIEEDVMRLIDPKKISNTTVDELRECQSKALQLSPLPKRHGLQGLACSVLIREDQSSVFNVPELEADADEPEKLDYHDLFHSTVKEGTRRCVKPYLVIPSDSSPQWRESVGLAATTYVDCGARLSMTSGRFSGVHTTYEYFSTGPGSCTAMHVEDGFLGSMNFVLAGAPKVWLFVQPRYRRKLEQKAREDLTTKQESYPCSQFMRHLNTLLSPQVLDSWDIPYHIVPCKAGEMIVTLPETYHQVVNAGANYAQAINFAVEPDWTRPPSDYEFCTSECNPDMQPITAAQLSIQEITLNSNHGASLDEQGHSNGEGSVPSKRRESSQALGDNTTTLGREVGDLVDKAITLKSPTFPRTPGDPTSADLTTRGSSPTGREKDQNASPPLQNKDASCEGGDGKEKALDNTHPVGGLAHLASAENNGEADTQGFPSHKKADGGAAAGDSLTETHTTFSKGDPKTPIELAEEPDVDSSDLVEIPLRVRASVCRDDESIEAKIDRLIEEASLFLPALDISRATLDRFRPRQWLNDEAILKTMETILPDKAKPLIASSSFRNFPPSGLANDFTGVEMPQDRRPQLIHDTDSTHLFLAYNVQAGSLEHAIGGSGNHWVLIVADFLNKKMHFFGVEKGAETSALTVIRNIGASINSFRLSYGREQIEWSFAESQPLYPNSLIPDNYNCGIAAISLAEAFIYPEKALKVTHQVTLAELSQRLDELRGIYLECIVRRYSRVCDDEVVSAQLGALTPSLQGKKRPSPFPIPNGKRISAAKSSFQRRSSDASMLISETIPRSEAEQWKHCIFQTAQNTGFNGASLVETFERLPNNPLNKVLRVLQCICEVANQDRLFQLKDVLKLRTQPLLEQPQSNVDLARLASLHSSIRNFVHVTYVARYQRYMSLVLYYQWFQSAVQLKSQQMKRARYERKCMANYVRKGSQSQVGPPKMQQNDQMVQREDSTQATTRLKDELVDLLVLVQKNITYDTARKELDQNIKEGKILHLLLSPIDNRSPRTDIRFLCLFPLYEPFRDFNVSRPSLDLMKYGPPSMIKKLRKPISFDELPKLTESLATSFGKHLFVMRPELLRIDANHLPGGSEEETGGTIYLEVAPDEELREAKPMDVAQFFEPTKKTWSTPR